MPGKDWEAEKRFRLENVIRHAEERIEFFTKKRDEAKAELGEEDKAEETESSEG